MITDMRDSISSWPIRIVLIVLILSFISFYGWQNKNSNLAAGEVANVNGEGIKAQDFSIQYQNLVQNYQRQGRLPADTPEGLMNILKQQLLTSMIYQKLKASEAKKVGLVPSNEKTAEIIKKQFSDPEGKFDFKFYENYLRNQMGKTPGQYEEQQRQNLRAQLFEQLVLETGLASNLQLKDSYKKNNEKVVLSYVKLNEKSTVIARPAPKAASVDELEAFYRDNEDLFKTKEKRKLDIVYFDKFTFGKTSNFEKDAEKEIQKNAQASNFAELAAKDKRLHHVTTSLVGYEDVVNPLTSAELTEVLNSTQSLESGRSTVLVSRDGNKVFLTQLLELQASKLPDFAAIKSQVEKEYASSRAEEQFNDWLDASWKNISEGKQSLEGFAKTIKSSVKDTESFANDGSGNVPGVGNSPEAADEAFLVSKEKSFFTKPIKIGDDYVLFKLKTKSEPDWKKFEAEHDNLASALHQQTAQTRFVSWMSSVEKNAKIKREMGMTGTVPETEEE